MRKCRALRHMIMQIERVKQGVICIASTTFRSAVSNLKRRGIAPAACELLSAKQWEEWSIAFAEALPSLTSQLVKLRARDPTRNVTSANRLWQYGKGNRQFFQRLLRKRATTKLESVIDPQTGERSWDPTVVKEQVAQKIGSLFSTRVENPDVRCLSPCTGLCGDPIQETNSGTCFDARCSCRPPWWDLVYSQRKAGGVELFSDIMRPAGVDEMLSCLRSTGSGKAPGFDLVSVDLLRIICDDGLCLDPLVKGISASVLLMLCNASMALGVVPRHA